MSGYFSHQDIMQPRLGRLGLERPTVKLDEASIKAKTKSMYGLTCGQNANSGGAQVRLVVYNGGPDRTGL